MHKCTRQELPHRLLSCFTPVSKIRTGITRLASSGFNIYLPRYIKKNTKKFQISRSKNLEFLTTRAKKQCHLINLE